MARLPLLILYCYPNYIIHLPPFHNYTLTLLLRIQHLIYTLVSHCISLASLPGSSAYTVTHLKGRTHLLLTITSPPAHCIFQHEVLNEHFTGK